MKALFAVITMIMIAFCSSFAAASDKSDAMGCFMGDCFSDYIISLKAQPSGTIAAKIRTVFHCTPGFSCDHNTGDVQTSTNTVLCKEPGGFIESALGRRVSEPERDPPHATQEARDLWFAICKKAQSAAQPSGETVRSRLSFGPSFPCKQGQPPLAQLLCAEPMLSMADLLFAQAYWALLYQLDQPGKQGLKQEDLSFINGVQQRCGVPAAGEAPILTAELRECIQRLYDERRRLWLSRLSETAAEEAKRPIERHITLQRDLQTLGLLPSTATIDGVYGDGTRTAIVAWQRGHGRSVTGFLSEADSESIEAEVANRPPATGAAAAAPGTEKPAAPESNATGEGLTVTVTPSRTDTALVIKGEIRNEAKDSRDVPKLRVAIRDANQAELAMKVVDAPVDHLEPGATAPFETSFDPNDQAVGVAVTFVPGTPKRSAAVTAPGDAVTQINALLADIYSHYPRAIQRRNAPPWRMPYAAQIFDPPMVDLLVEEQRLASGPDGGIVAFDSDPLCDCQDDEGMRPTVGDVKITGLDTATANVDLRWMCSVSQSPRLTPADRQRMMSQCWTEHKNGLVDDKQLKFDLVLVNGAWRIHDIHSPTISSLREHIINAMRDVRQPANSSAVGKGAAPVASDSDHAPIKGTVTGIPDAATLLVGGKQLRLEGIEPGPRQVLGPFASWLRARSPVECQEQEAGLYRCVTSNGVDVGEAALLNGAARAAPDASTLYKQRESDARGARRGLWQRR